MATLMVTVLAVASCTSATGSNPTATPATTAQIETRTITVGGGAYTDVGPAGLARMLEDKDFPLINVHIPYEGEIEPTDLFIPYNEMGANLDKLPADKSARIVLYCQSDRMSEIAARELVGEGYTDVWNLDGGMVDWQAQGYPLAHKSR